jgi:hypothetical protein
VSGRPRGPGGADSGAPDARGALLYGREGGLRGNRRVLDQARFSRGTALILTGSAGIGKTMLLGYARSTSASMRVLEMAGLEPETDLPFAALRRLLAPVLSYIERLPGPQAGALPRRVCAGPSSGVHRFAIALGTLSHLAEVAAEGPLLCLVEDAHWLDQPSGDALTFAARHMKAEGIAMLFAARPGDESPLRDSRLPKRVIQALDVGAAARPR